MPHRRTGHRRTGHLGERDALTGGSDDGALPYRIPPFWPRLDDLAEVYAALVLGTADYVRKNGFRSVLLALSGGIDSALVATIAADAVGPENVHVILMPSKWSSDHSVTDAEDLVERQGINARTVPIQPIVDAFQGRARGLPRVRAARGEPAVPGARRDQHGGIQRTRGTSCSPPATRARSPPGTRLCTATRPGGSARSRTCRRRWSGRCPGGATRRPNGSGSTPPIPQNSITKPPSAELAPGQLDTDSLP